MIRDHIAVPDGGRGCGMTQEEFDNLVASRGRLAAGPWTRDDDRERWTRVDAGGEVCGSVRVDVEENVCTAWVAGYDRYTCRSTWPVDMLIQARGWVDACLAAQGRDLVGPVTLYAVEAPDRRGPGGV